MPRYKGTPVHLESLRVRLFQLLAKYPEGLRHAEMKAPLQTTRVRPLCRDEVVAGRMKVVRYEDDPGMRFCLTAKGRKALSEGTVDTEAPPKSRGWGGLDSYDE